MHKTISLLLISASMAGAVACQPVRAQSPEEESPIAGAIEGEPISGDPVTPNPGDATEVKDPFAPYGIGPPEHAITRWQLSPKERAAVDRSRNADPSTLEAYRQAVLQRSASITSAVAAHQLGVDNLKRIGVVP